MKRIADFKVLILIFAAAMIGGGVPVFTKIALVSLPPFPFTFLRFFIAFICLIPIILWKKEEVNLHNFIKTLPVTLLGTLNVIVFAFGIQRTTASSAQMLYALTPVIAGIMSYIILKEKFKLPKIIGILLGFVGAFIIILLPIINKGAGISGANGNLIVFGAVSAYALYTVYSKMYQKNFSPIILMFYFTIAATITSLIFTVLDPNLPNLMHQRLSSAAIFDVLYVSIGGTILFYLAIQYIIKHSTPTTASTVSFLQPIFTIIWAVTLLNENITAGFIIGAIITFLGVILVTFQHKLSRNTNAGIN